MAPKKKQQVYNRRYSAKKGSNLIENIPNVKSKNKRSMIPPAQIQASLNNKSDDPLVTPKSDLTIAISKGDHTSAY